MLSARSVARLRRASSARPIIADPKRLEIRPLWHRWLPLGVAVVAMGIALPCLRVGYLLDDLFQHALLLGRLERSPWAMFSLGGHDPLSRHAWMDSGLVPWWTSERFHFALLRVLTVATHRLDHALWPNSPVLMHAHSMVWFGLLAAVATCLYRRILGANSVAGLAALAYAVDEVHVWPVGWLANRNALLTTLFGLLCLLAHDRYRRDGWRPGAWLAPFALALALASGESATATLGYLIAYVIDRPPPRRVRALASGPSPVTVTRRDARTLEVGMECRLFRGVLDRHFRDAAHPLTPGQTIALSGLNITIEEVAGDGSPTRILYQFDRALGDASLRWVCWQDGIYVPFTLPAVGMTVRFAPAVGPLEELAGVPVGEDTIQCLR